MFALNTTVPLSTDLELVIAKIQNCVRWNVSDKGIPRQDDASRHT